MKAEFNFEKVVVRGEKMLKFTGFKNVLGFDELPKEYTQYIFPSSGKITVGFYARSDTCIYCSSMPSLIVGNVYSRDEIREYVVMAKRAGAKLTEINKNLEKVNKDWTGVTTIAI